MFWNCITTWDADKKNRRPLAEIHLRRTNRDKTSLDVLAEEIIENLEAGRNSFRTVLSALRKGD